MSVDMRLCAYGVYGFILSFVHDKGRFVRLTTMPSRYKKFLSHAAEDAKKNNLYVPKIKITLQAHRRRSTYILKTKRAHSPGWYYCKKFHQEEDGLKEFDPASPSSMIMAMEFFYAQWCKEHLTKKHPSPKFVTVAIKFKKPDVIATTRKRKRTISASLKPAKRLRSEMVSRPPPILNCPLCNGTRWWESNVGFKDRYQRMLAAGYSDAVAFAVKHMSAGELASPKHLLTFVPCLCCNPHGTGIFALKQQEDKKRKCELKKCYWMHLLVDPIFAQPLK